MSVECVQEEVATVTPAGATLSAFKWVRLKDTWINLDNVTYIEDAEYWLAVYFRLDHDAQLWRTANLASSSKSKASSSPWRWMMDAVCGLTPSSFVIPITAMR